MKHRSILIAVSLVALFILGFWLFRPTAKPTYQIAYLGRYVGSNDDQESIVRSRKFADMHTLVIQNYIETFNKSHDIDLELVVYDNQKDLDSTLAVYRQIHRNEGVLAVIDNTWGAEIIGAKEFIKESGLPAISINASVYEKEGYGPHFLATTNYEQSFREIAYYIKNALLQDTINFISDASTWKHENYLQQIENVGLHINKSLVFDINETKELDAEEVVQTVLDNDYITILNGNNRAIGDEILSIAYRNSDNEVVIGHPEIVGGGNTTVDITGDNKLILLSQSESATSKETIKQVEALRARRPDIDELFNTAFFIGRCKTAMEILTHAIGDNVDPNREEIGQSFHSLFDANVTTSDDLLFFDDKGFLIRENTFVSYTSAGEAAIELQINTLGKIIPNINFGIEIIDIQDLELSTNSFTADFYYWVTSDSTFTNIEEFITFQNIKPSESEINLITSKKFGNLIYRLYKVSGVFFENYKESNYPFDTQEISIDIQVLNTAERLRVSFDKESFNQKISDFSLKGWIQNGFYVTVDNTLTNKLKGNLELGASDINKFKNISFRFNVSRSKLPGVLQIVLPLFFIGILSITLLYLKDLNFAHIGEPLAAVFLTIIAFSISLSDITPTGNVLTKTDYLFILTLSIVVISFLIGLFHNTSRAISKRTVVIARVAITIFYIITFSIIVIV